MKHPAFAHATFGVERYTATGCWSSPAASIRCSMVIVGLDHQFGVMARDREAASSGR
jgi:hypothetical protein